MSDDKRTVVSSDFYTQSEITWDIALRAAYVLNDSFSSDFLRQEYWPKKYDFSKIHPLPGYDRLVSTPQPFQIAVHHTARSIFYEARTNPRYCLIMGRNWETQEDIALATIFVPKYSAPFKTRAQIALEKEGEKPLDWWWRDQPKKSLLQKMVSWVKLPFFKLYGCLQNCSVYVSFENSVRKVILSSIFKAWDIWETKSLSDPFAPPAMRAVFSQGAVACKAIATPESANALKTMSWGELVDVTYPKELSYNLNYFAIATNQQGRGVGSQFMKLVLSELKNAAEITSPPGIDGPAKMEFFSSPAGAPFYKRFGFRLGASEDTVQPSGRVLTQNFFFMNLI